MNNSFVITRCYKCSAELDCFDEANGLKIEHAFGYGSKFDGHSICIRYCCYCSDRVLQRLLEERRSGELWLEQINT